MDDELIKTIDIDNIHKKVLDTIPEPISIIGKNYTYLYANKAYSELFNSEPEAIINNNVEFFFGGKIFNEIIKPKIDSCLIGNCECYELDFNINKNLGSRYMEVKYYRLCDKKGIPVAIITAAKDITSEKNFKKDWSRIVDSIDDSIITIDDDFCIRNLNEKTLNLLNLPKNEVLNKKCYELFHGTNEPIPECPLLKCKKDGKGHKEEVFEPKFGKYFTIKTTPFFDEEGKIIKYVETTHDITDLKLALTIVMQNEEKYRLLVENQGEGVGIINFEEKFVFANLEAEKIFEVGAGELIGKKLSKFMNDDNYKLIIEQSKKRKKGEKSEYELEIITHSGKIKTLQLTATPQYDNNKKIIGTFGVFSDITEKKKIREQIQKSEKLFRLLTENSQDVIYRMSLPDGNYEYISPKIEKLFGYPQQIFYDNPHFVKEILHKNFIEFFNDEFQKLLKGEAPQTYEYKIIDKNNNERWLFQRNILIKDENGNPVAIEGSITDITQLKETELKLKESNFTKDKIFSIISHDLRSPFNTILGYSKMLISKYDKIDDEQKLSIINSFYETSKKTFNLIENLLIWSKYQLNNFSVEKTNFNLFEFIENICDYMDNSITDKKISLYINIEKNKIVFADKAMTETIFRNLISNAVKFSNVNGKIEIFTLNSSEKSETIVCVKDEGVGICPEKLKLIFNFGNNISTQGTNQEKGTGLGLYICKEFADKMDGKIWAESEFNKGSTFYLKIPNK